MTLPGVELWPRLTAEGAVEVAAGGRTILNNHLLWDAESGEFIRDLGGAGRAFSPDGRRLAVISVENQPGPRLGCGNRRSHHYPLLSSSPISGPVQPGRPARPDPISTGRPRCLGPGGKRARHSHSRREALHRCVEPRRQPDRRRPARWLGPALGSTALDRTVRQQLVPSRHRSCSREYWGEVAPALRGTCRRFDEGLVDRAGHL